MSIPNINTNTKNRKKSSSVDISSMMYGKIPPQAKELEEAVLGGILLEKSAFDTVTEILKPEFLYRCAPDDFYCYARFTNGQSAH